MDESVGSLEPGHMADFVLLDRDPVASTDPQAIRATRLGSPSEAIVIADGRQGANGNAWNQLATWEAPSAHVPTAATLRAKT